MKAEELSHHRRVVDMMLTMHSALRDRYSRRALAADLLLLLFSLILNALVFLDPSILKALGVNQDAARVAIGVFSVVLLFLSLVSWRVDWKERAQAHSQAADTLGKLKLDCKSVIEAVPADEHLIEEQADTCAWVLNSLPKIPEAQFIKLKALHKRKIRLSQLLDTFPAVPLPILRAKLMWDNVLEYLGRKRGSAA